VVPGTQGVNRCFSVRIGRFDGRKEQGLPAVAAIIAPTRATAPCPLLRLIPIAQTRVALQQLGQDAVIARYATRQRRAPWQLKGRVIASHPLLVEAAHGLRRCRVEDLSMNPCRNSLIRHCEERSDAATQGRWWGRADVLGLPRRAPLSRRAPRNDDLQVHGTCTASSRTAHLAMTICRFMGRVQLRSGWLSMNPCRNSLIRHCEERSDAATQGRCWWLSTGPWVATVFAAAASKTSQ